MKELAPDKSNNTFMKSELFRVEAPVQQRAFERRRAQPNDAPMESASFFQRVLVGRRRSGNEASSAWAIEVGSCVGVGAS